MSIVMRRGWGYGESWRCRSRFDRSRPPAPTPASTDLATAAEGIPPERILARIALELIVQAARPKRMPPRWRTPSFGREVGAVRGRLGPIRSRRALAASFSRDAAIAATTPPTPTATGAPASGASARALGLDAPGPVRVAYAIRWLELGDGRERASWEAWLQGAEAGLASPIAVAAGGPPKAQRIGDSNR
jgi:hypothetical protein